MNSPNTTNSKQKITSCKNCPNREEDTDCSLYNADLCDLPDQWEQEQDRNHKMTPKHKVSLTSQTADRAINSQNNKVIYCKKFQLFVELDTTCNVNECNFDCTNKVTATGDHAQREPSQEVHPNLTSTCTMLLSMDNDQAHAKQTSKNNGDQK